MTSDWEILSEREPWLIPRGSVNVLGPTSGSGSWVPKSVEFGRLFPILNSLLSRSRITPLKISGESWTLFAWGDPDVDLAGWLSPTPLEVPPKGVFQEHRVLLDSFGGVNERFNDPESTWLLNHIDALTLNAALSDASFIADYDWAFQQHGLPIPIDLSAYYCLAREANGNTTLCHRVNGDILMFAPDHSFDHLDRLEGCPEYTLYRIREARSFQAWVERVAAQWADYVYA